MLNVISTCRDILCVDINVDKRCVDHSTNFNHWQNRKGFVNNAPVVRVVILSARPLSIYLVLTIQTVILTVILNSFTFK